MSATSEPKKPPEPDQRNRNATCTDCPTVRRMGEMLKWHELVYRQPVESSAELVCGSCYLERCTKVWEE